MRCIIVVFVVLCVFYICFIVVCLYLFVVESWNIVSDVVVFVGRVDIIKLVFE